MAGLRRTQKETLHRDRFTRADIHADTALGAVVGTRENGDVLEVVAAHGALVHADAARGTEIRIDDGYGHAWFLSPMTPKPLRVATMIARVYMPVTLPDLVCDFGGTPQTERIGPIGQHFRVALL
jgi:hypothetical protein